LNGEKPGKFDELKTISLLTLVLHLKGQRNVTKTFDEMLKLGRKISEAFDMQLLDDDFNALSEQSISNYRETTNNIDLKTGAYVS
jgi:FtsZ-interacting cell division protein ZipA